MCVSILSGCNEKSVSLTAEEKRFVGTWKEISTNSTLTFFSDGTCTSYLAPNYEVKDGKLVFSTYTDGNKIQIAYDYVFSDNDTILTIASVDTGETDVYTKQ